MQSRISHKRCDSERLSKILTACWTGVRVQSGFGFLLPSPFWNAVPDRLLGAIRFRYARFVVPFRAGRQRHSNHRVGGAAPLRVLDLYDLRSDRLSLDLVARKLGESGVQKVTGQSRFEYLKKKIGQKGGYFLALACLSPPPFPFTMLVATICALSYPRRKLLAIVAVCRLMRFLLLSYLAIHYGRRILRMINTSEFKYAMIAFAIVCLIVSGFSIAKWVNTSRAERARL